MPVQTLSQLAQETILQTAFDPTVGALVTKTPYSWAIVHTPAVNTAATISKAAGAAGLKHVCNAISATFVAGTSAPTAVVVSVALRDGATGAGTILWQANMALPATAGATANPILLTDLCIQGTAATAMTLEFSAAGGANTFENVSLVGYTTA